MRSAEMNLCIIEMAVEIMISFKDQQAARKLFTRRALWLTRKLKLIHRKTQIINSHHMNKTRLVLKLERLIARLELRMKRDNHQDTTLH